MSKSLNSEYDELQVLLRLHKQNSQKSIANEMRMAIGKVNYIVKALIDKGFLKMGNFINEEDKSKYKYLLTQKGLELKINATKKFLKIKKEEYEQLQKELEECEMMQQTAKVKA